MIVHTDRPLEECTELPNELVQDRRLSYSARGLYAAILAGEVLSTKEKRADIVQKSLRELARFGYSEHLTKLGIDLSEVTARAEAIKAKVLTAGKHKCAWCHAFCHFLHRHHYPLPAKLYGAEVVGICGRCHADFHRWEEQTP